MIANYNTIFYGRMPWADELARQIAGNKALGTDESFAYKADTGDFVKTSRDVPTGK